MMIRFVLILTLLATLHDVYGQDKLVAPIKQPDLPLCTSVLCDKNTDDKLDDLIQDVADTCNCCSCGCKSKIHFDLCALCEAYRNYDPKTNGISQCVINKLSNPCYTKYYNSFLQILNSGCGNICQKNNFNIYTFLYDVCYGCNGCLDGCYIQNGYTIYYSQPLEASGGAKLTSTVKV
ncbi:uncharacterized protein LOC116342163 [Contarinia nasturtii]|uniref:uncharacterized protein LOC116342163 n=1 Tax=Contarinia nasturtii TaxID=265458 RepID=UPI0012D3DBFB|nr:uncharacterized protein LOC116342163 [Contarinia nasturtii]